MLKNYVNHCATKIQKVFKGHYTRKVTIKIKRAFNTLEEKFSACITGWRVRRIMKTKEIENYIL